MTSDHPDIHVPDFVRTLLLYGGGFDPPHIGHIELPRKVRGALGADWLLYIPAASPPLRDSGPIASAEDRLAMVRAAIMGDQRASATDLEIRRGGTSYTIDTVRTLREALPFVKKMRLLIGADQAAQFHKWKSADELIELAEPVVVLRAPMESRSALRQAMADHCGETEWERWRGRIVRLPTIEASSTQIRQILRERGPDDAALRELLPAPVLELIRERGLYRG